LATDHCIPCGMRVVANQKLSLNKTTPNDSFDLVFVFDKLEMHDNTHPLRDACGCQFKNVKNDNQSRACPPFSHYYEEYRILT